MSAVTGRLRNRLTYANVMSTLAVFVALGGASYAATQLPRNSVGPKQLRKGAVTGAKVKPHSLTGIDLNLAKLGTVPAAAHAATADSAGHAASADSAGHATSADSAQSAAIARSLAPAEPSRLVGAPGQPPFLDGTHNGEIPGGAAMPQPAAFYKDQEGIVHLEGAVKVGSTGLLFNLPPGYRPARGTILYFPQPEEQILLVLGEGVNLEGLREGDVTAAGALAGKDAFLGSITFRAAS